MARVWMPLPDRDFDVTEVAVPWRLLTRAGHGGVFTTERGARPACDPLLLTGVIFGQLGPTCPGVFVASTAGRLDVRTYVRHRSPMKRTATDLRAHLYEVLDHVATTGQPVEIARNGVDLAIVRRDKVRRPTKVPRTLPKLVVGNPDELVHQEWSSTEGRDL